MRIVNIRKQKGCWLFDLDMSDEAKPMKIHGFKFTEKQGLFSPERKGSGRKRGNGGKRTLYAVTLPWNTTWKELKALACKTFLPRLERAAKIRRTRERNEIRRLEEFRARQAEIRKQVEAERVARPPAAPRPRVVPVERPKPVWTEDEKERDRQLFSIEGDMEGL